MFNTNYNNITITRGDSGVLNLSLSNYELQDGDNIVLTVKKDTYTKAILFQKDLLTDVMQFIIEPNDTKDLPYGKYVYDVQLTTEQGDVYTVVTPHSFIVDKEVTW